MNELLKDIYPQSTTANREKYGPALADAMRRYGIDTPNRKRAFLAQIGHESAQLSATVENLNYSAEALSKLFPKYFPTPELANRYARKPERIANRIYADRMGNGPEASRDGWKYRGRGLIQTTGKANYEALNAMPGHQGIDFVKTPDALIEPRFAADSAAYFWQRNGLNQLSDRLGGADDAAVFKQITRKINGGYNGLEDRVRLYERAKKYIS